MNSFDIISGDSPIILTAIHDGHVIRKELLPFLAIQEHDRLREEDPYTGYMTEVSDSRIVVNTSRFEVDLNRPREKAIYQKPEDAWGLQVWNRPLDIDVINRSLDLYDQFYAEVEILLRETIDRFGYFVILDLHSYNYRRKDPYTEDPSKLNPEINLGTASIPPSWKTLIHYISNHIAQLSIRGNSPDIRENVKFQGGEFSNWVNRNFGSNGFALAIEFKKVFMDEWTGRINIDHLQDIKKVLALTLPYIKHQFELIYQ